MKTVKKEKDPFMKVSTEELVVAATEIEQAADEMQLLTERIEKIMAHLEENWQDAGKQTFYQYYDEWHRYMGGFSQILNMTAKELKSIAENYEEVSG